MSQHGEQYPETSRSVDSLREMRLAALLADLIEERGKPQAAEALGVSVRTLGRFEDSRRLTRVLAAALETHLLQGGGSVAEGQRRQARDLETRVAELETALPDGLAAVRLEGKAASEEQSRALGEIQRRLAAVEAVGNGTAEAKGGAPARSGAAKAQPARPGTAGTPPVVRPRRDYAELVTRDPEPGEELVYGDAATAVIIKWREARDAAANATDRLAKLDARRRQLELEVALIGERELTLPPATYPWDWGDRRDQVRRRHLSLDDVRTDRRWALLSRRLHRALTLGLWRR